MADFQAFDATTHPIVRLENDYNNILAHGIRKRYGCMVWKNGAVYEATNLATGLIVYGGADNVGVVDGTDVSAVCDAVVDTGSYKYLFIASQGTTITWERDNIPANTIVEGDVVEYVVIKEQDNPDANYVTLSHESMIVNLSVWDKGGVDIGMGANGPRQVNFHSNNRVTNTVNVSSWENQFIVVDTGEAATDNPGIAVNQFGIGDAFYAGVQGNGLGINIQVNTGDLPGTGIGLGTHLYGAGHGAFFNSSAGATGILAHFEQEDDVIAINIQGDADTTTDIDVNSTTKTTGQQINLYQNTSAFTGNGITFNYAIGSGSFTGSYFNCFNNALFRGKLEYTGQLWLQKAAVGDYISLRVDADGNDRCTLSDAGLFFGTGGAVVDCDLHRNAANQWITPDQLVCSDGIVTFTKAGAITDADMTVDTIGLICLDITNDVLYCRTGAAEWHTWNATAGFVIPSHERKCPLCEEEIKVGEQVAGVVEREHPSPPGSLHGLYTHLRCSMKKAMEE